MKVIFLQPDSERAQEFDLDIIGDALRGMGESLLERTPYIVAGVIVFGLFLLLARIVKRSMRALGERTRLDVRLTVLFGRLASVAMVVLGLLVAAVVIFPGFRPADLIAGLGITSVAIGFAFKDILQNFFAGILILWRSPFRVGDQIRTKDFEGTVEDINTRSTWIRTYDGERVIVPNADIYTNAILVRTAFGKRRVRLTLGIGYPDSIEEARGTIGRALAETEGVLDDPGPWVYVSELAPSSVNFTIYFWTEPRQANVLAVSDRVATAIKLALDGVGIDIPYPHQVVLFHDATGGRKGDIEREVYLGHTDGSVGQTMRQAR